MKVLFVDHTARIGGGEVVLLSLGRELRRTGYEVAVACPAGPLAREAREAGLAHVSLPEGRCAVEAVRACRQAMRAFRPDIVHLNSLRAGLIGGLAARQERVTSLWHLHDLLLPEFYGPAKRFVAARAMRAWAGVVVANSRATAKALTRAMGQGKLRCVVVPNGVDLDAFRVQPLPAEHTVGIFSRVDPWKGHLCFVDAAARVAREVREADFLVVGDAVFERRAYARRVVEEVRRRGLAERFRFAGFRRDVPALLAQVRVAVHASLKPEPFGLTVVEAMACGRPVVAAEGGGVPEIVVPGKTGVLFSVGDAAALAGAVAGLLRDGERAARLGLAGRARVEAEFDIRLMGKRIALLYEALVGGDLSCWECH